MLLDGRSATSSATPDSQSETAPNPVADGAENVADGVAVRQGENLSEINDVAGVAGRQREDGEGGLTGGGATDLQSRTAAIRNSCYRTLKFQS